MKKKDHATFASAMANTFSVYAVECTQELLSAWWTALEPYSIDGVEAALAYHVGDYQGFGYRAPTPADVRKILEETLPSLRRQRCAVILADATQRSARHRERQNEAINNYKTLDVISQEEYRRILDETTAALEAIANEPRVIEARAPFTFRDADLPKERMALPIEKAIAVIGRGKK